MTIGKAYPLETLMTLKQLIKEQWEQRLAQDLERLRHAEMRLTSMSQHLEELSRGIDQHRRIGADQRDLSIAEHQVQERYLERLQGELALLRHTQKEALQAREGLREAAAQTQQKLAQAEAGLRVLQKHFAAWDRTRCQEEQRRAEEELEELVAARR